MLKRFLKNSLIITSFVTMFINNIKSEVYLHFKNCSDKDVTLKLERSKKQIEEIKKMGVSVYPSTNIKISKGKEVGGGGQKLALRKDSFDDYIYYIDNQKVDLNKFKDKINKDNKYSVYFLIKEKPKGWLAPAVHLFTGDLEVKEVNLDNYKAAC